MNEINLKKLTTVTIFFMSLFLLLSGSVFVHAKGTTKRTRQINVVYDDSGSMAYDQDQYVTRWSEAKYALEVFAAMMSETDNMTIYPMSSFSYSGGNKSETWRKTYSLSGKQDVKERTDTINKMNGSKGLYMNTPIETVKAAGDDFKNSDADEKWLVILTDGAFDDGKGKKIGPKATDTILGYAQQDGPINVAYIPIGGDSDPIASESRNYTTVPKDMDILDQVKTVAKTVYNYQSISFDNNNSKYILSPDIPVSKFIIFAQGKDVSVNDMMFDDKQTIKNDSAADVQVAKNTKYRPATHKYPDASKMIVAPGLKGQVITYNSKAEDKPFAAGKYTFDSNVSNVEVFFEPGVSVEAFITNTDGEEINLSDNSVTELEAGKKTLHVKMINPLTGEEIDPKSSAMLEGVELSMNLTDQDGNAGSYKDGEPVDIPEGEILIFAKAKFKGNIEKTSSEKSLKVKPAKLSVIFSKPEGYQIDPLNLSGTDIRFEIRAADRSTFAEEDYKNARIELGDAGGFRWDCQYIGEGQYQLIPSMEKGKSLNDIDTALADLAVDVAIQSGKIERTGGGTTKIAPFIGESVSLQLNLKMPEERYTDKSNHTYMFDSTERGSGASAPYILVEVKTENKDGTTSILSENEWKQGLNSFSINAKQVDANILYKIIRILCRQKLVFDVKLGDEVSTYKLYLSGMTTTGVLPGKSELNVDMDITLDNHIKEQGNTSGYVTVKPVSLFRYMGRFLAILLLLLLLILLLIMELQKKRIPRDMEPNSTAFLEKAGIPITPPVGSQFSRKKIKYVIFPPLRPEEKKVTMKYPQYLTPITFILVAAGNGRFTIKNLDKKFISVRNRVTFDGRSYDEAIAVKDGMQFSKNSNITIQVSLGLIKGEVKLTFTKANTPGVRRKISKKKKKRQK